MELNVLLWILAGGFAGTWGLIFYFMNRTDQLMWAIQQEIKTMNEEMKDFHGRLCAIEERNKSK
jgi:hypothetical protein